MLIEQLMCIAMCMGERAFQRHRNFLQDCGGSDMLELGIR